MTRPVCSPLRMVVVPVRMRSPVSAFVELKIKAGQMFQPIRVAVCGRKNAPPLFETLEVLGRDTSLKRIGKAVAMLS